MSTAMTTTVRDALPLMQGMSSYTHQGDMFLSALRGFSRGRRGRGGVRRDGMGWWC